MAQEATGQGGNKPEKAGSAPGGGGGGGAGGGFNPLAALLPFIQGHGNPGLGGPGPLGILQAGLPLVLQHLRGTTGQGMQGSMVPAQMRSQLAAQQLYNAQVAGAGLGGVWNPTSHYGAMGTPFPFGVPPSFRGFPPQVIPRGGGGQGQGWQMSPGFAQILAQLQAMRQASLAGGAANTLPVRPSTTLPMAGAQTAAFLPGQGPGRGGGGRG